VNRPTTLVATAMVLAACSPATDTAPGASTTETEAPPVLVHSSIRADSALQALFMGRLHLDSNGCIRGGSDTGPLIVWHHDTRIERTDDGRILITDGSSGNSAYVGDEVAMAGGRGTGAPTNTAEPIPEVCISQEYWGSGYLMSEAERQAILERERNRIPVPSPE